MGPHKQAVPGNPHSGFRNIGEQAFAVYNALVNGMLDSRLMAAAPSTVSKEGLGSDGGYAVPPDCRSEVVRAVLAETSLLGLTDRQIASSNSLVVPVDASPLWSTSGPKPSVEGEGDLLAQSKLAAQSRTVKLTKIQVFVPVSNELLEDATGLDAYLRATAPDRLDFKVTDFLINGDGVLKPHGLLNYPCKIMQTKEAAQPAGTVVYANVQKMWGRLYSPSKARAVWVCHSDVETALQGMTAPTGAPALVYWPGEAFPRLFGRPVLVTEAAQGLGTEGDLILVDPKGMLTATREGVARADLSMDLWFDLGLSAFRFTVRVGAAPWWNAPISRYRSGSTISTVVTLESR